MHIVSEIYTGHFKSFLTVFKPLKKIKMWRFSNAFDTQKCSDNAEILLSLHQFINNVNLFLKLYFQNRNENVSCCPIIFLLYYRFFRYNLRFDTVASHHFRLHSLNILNTPVQFLFLLRVFYQLCFIYSYYTFFAMARLESPCQIFGVFLGAGLIAMGVIYFLNIEAAKRFGQNLSGSNR